MRQKRVFSRAELMELALDESVVPPSVSAIYGRNRAIAQFSQQCLDDPEFRHRVVHWRFFWRVRRRTQELLTLNPSAANGRTPLPDDYFERMELVTRILQRIPGFSGSPLGLSLSTACRYVEQALLVATAVSEEADEDIMAFSSEFLATYELPPSLLDSVANAALIISISWRTPVRLEFEGEELFFYEFDTSDELHRRHLAPSGHSTLDDALRYMQAMQRRKRVPGWGRRRIEGTVERNVAWFYQHKVRGKSLTALAQEELEGEGATRKEAKSRVYEGNRQRNVGHGISSALDLLADWS